MTPKKDKAEEILASAFNTVQPEEKGKNNQLDSDKFLEQAFNTPGIVVEKEEAPDPKREARRRAMERKLEEKKRRDKEKEERAAQKLQKKKIAKPAAPKPPKAAIKKKAKTSPPPIPFDADIPLLPGEETKWTGAHHKLSDIKGYVGFSVAMSFAIFCLGIALIGTGVEDSGYWNMFLFVLVIFVIAIFSLSSQSAEGNPLLAYIEVALAAISALLIAMTFLSVLYEQLIDQYSISLPSGVPEEFASMANLPIASLIFVGMLLFVFVIITSLKGEAPKQYRKSLTAAAAVVLLTGASYLFMPQLLEEQLEHSLFALYIFTLFLLAFSFILFFGLSTKKTRYVVTNKRIVVIKVYLGKEVWMKTFTEIERVKARQGLIGAKYGFGEITMTITTITGRPHILIINGVPEPFKVENMIYTGISMARSRTTQKLK
ncbi:MAG: PH domain-containing protein [Candidatus Thermoplasmatota archaeon]|nr:PH domain-containing protein [Candidatus Thermoplasmatota archaeon]